MGKVVFNTRKLSDVANDPAYAELPKQIFGEYCFENELHVLAGDTNVGKTILAMDMAVSFSSGTSYWGESLSEVHGCTLYINFEMGNNQIYHRYHSADRLNLENIAISTLNPTAYNMDTDALISAIVQLIVFKTPQLVIIDNLMWLIGNSGSATKTAKVMSTLKAIKEEYRLTMIVIAHCNKRNGKKPISVDDIFGSSAISKIADSISAIGSHGKRKYMKMLKSRSSSVSEDVAALEISNTPYLHMEFKGYDAEENYLDKKKASCTISPDDQDIIIEMHIQGVSVRNIAEQTGYSKSSIGRFVKAYDDMKS